ncbi:type VII secretion-associated serine protease mycosin [Sanguibacter gelidistatuariae]|uniref:Type VII secretion-associated serine protease mycosin n=1 Tax=Sanguibacter gelidistatuariae TaxID=1814289 RepID=A0A1G6RZN3_9MICO|nr:S8 family serine peptidase [Sanguibacter gelidistatuariae]SDD09861.1 type VII secretion-associated serine protease mycosin [Sanguibacter gelidistatuariae]
MIGPRGWLLVPLLAAQLGGQLLLAPAQALASGLTVLPTANETCSPDVTSYSPAAPAALATLNAELAWRTATGKGVTVAVVDSGVAAANTHLTSAVLPGISLTDTPGADNSATTDVMAHGTAVAGQIAARPVDGSGVVGLAPDAKILPVRVYFSQDQQVADTGNGPRSDRLAAGIRAAADGGAQIINVSMSTAEDTPELRDAVVYATGLGSLVVASAGNRNTTDDQSDSPRYPAAYPEVLSVTSVDAAGIGTADAIHGPHVDVAAPGTDVLTTFLAAGDCMLSSGLPSTSYATAYVSAAAALIAQEHPRETPAQWAFRLEVTASRTILDRRDDVTGWGTIRPAEALAFVDDGSARGPDSPVHPRPAPPAAQPQALDLDQVVSPLDETHRVAMWWTLGGVVAALATVLAGQLAVTRHRARPGRRTPPTS